MIEFRSQASRAQNNAASWQERIRAKTMIKKMKHLVSIKLIVNHRKSIINFTKKSIKKKCLCKKIHLFRNCSYMIISARPTGFKKDKQLRTNIRIKIQKSVMLFLTIRKFCNTNLLDGITENSVKKARTNQQSQQSAKLENENNSPKFTFANVTGNFKNPLHASVIYDSRCDNHLTFDRNRFVGKLRKISPNQWINIPNGKMRVQKYEAMLMKNSLKKQSVNLIFEKTVYIFTFEVTFVFTNKLKQKGFIWNMYENCILIKTIDQKMCEISKHFDLSTFEYKFVFFVFTLTNSVQFKNKKKRFHERDIFVWITVVSKWSISWKKLMK